MKNFDLASHTTGKSQYVDDVAHPENLLHAAIYDSPIAHGKILKLHLDDARKTEGVAAVLTAEDIPGKNQIGGIIPDETLLAQDKVQYLGEPVAIVVAKTPEIARHAVKKIRIDLEELPIVIDPRKAFEKGDIIGTPRTFEMGDIEASWDQCNIVVEGSCEIRGQEHAYLETQRARAIPVEDIMKVYSSTQSPYGVQKAVANILGLPHHKIEVDVKRLGGAFGGKEVQGNSWASMAALAANHLQRPVQIVLSRLEDLRMTGKRHPYSADFKMGLSKEGKILAYEAKYYQNAGAVADLSSAVLERTLFHGTNSYFIPNVRLFATSCKTNLPPNTAFRGFGGPQSMIVIESAIAKAAEKLNLTREEIQYKNLIHENDLFPYGQKAKHTTIQRTWDLAKEKFSLEKRKKAIQDYNEAHFESKKALSFMPICFGISFTAIFLNQASALVHIYTDGSISVSTGGVEMGQGFFPKIADIAAKAFGVDRKLINVEDTNTKRVANMTHSAASATTDLNGRALIKAISKILDRLKKFAAKELNLADDTKITIENNQLLYDGKETEWDWKTLITKAYFARQSLSGQAYYATPDIWFDKTKEKGLPFAYHVYGTAVTEVTLDCIRGTYNIDSVKIVHDLGRPINRMIDRGQIEGALSQGLGWMTIEDLQYNEKGQYTSSALATYKAPDVYFMPEVEIEFIEDIPSEYGPYGSKAVGEPPLMYGIGVLFALRDAMKAFSAKKDFPFTVPLTPEQVLMQMHSK